MRSGKPWCMRPLESIILLREWARGIGATKIEAEANIELRKRYPKVLDTFLAAEKEFANDRVKTATAGSEVDAHFEKGGGI